MTAVEKDNVLATHAVGSIDFTTGDRSLVVGRCMLEEQVAEVSQDRIYISY